MSKKRLLAHVGRVTVAFYLIATIALARALFATFIYMALRDNNSTLLVVFRSLSAILFLVGLVIFGLACIEFGISFKSRLFLVACYSGCVALLTFAVTGAFLLIIVSSVDPTVAASSNFFPFWQISGYLIPSFVVLFATAEIKVRCNMARASA